MIELHNFKKGNLSSWDLERQDCAYKSFTNTPTETYLEEAGRRRVDYHQAVNIFAIKSNKLWTNSLHAFFCF